MLDENGDVQFGVVESTATSSDGTVETSVSVSFVPPAGPGGSAAAGPGIPLLSLAPTVGTGGTLAGGQTLYYAVSGQDSAGNESALSFIVRASIVERREQRDAVGVEFRAGNQRVRRVSGKHAGGALSNRFRRRRWPPSSRIRGSQIN